MRRVAKGERYYYVDEKLEVVSHYEQDHIFDNWRFESNNYWNHREDAVAYAETIQAFARSQQAAIDRRARIANAVASWCED
jgi:phosphopentomutase